ncbi:hypothetical protein Bhyg_09627, partial [Pseudolycoriella hygida]
MIATVIVGLLLFVNLGLSKHTQGRQFRFSDVRFNIETSVSDVQNGNSKSFRESTKSFVNNHTLSKSEGRVVHILKVGYSQIFLELTCKAMDYEEIEIEPNVRHTFAKQIGIPSNPLGPLVNRLPCTCQSGVCGCCTGVLLAAFRTKGCMNITYIPEEFAFEVKMMMNDAVLYKNRMSGRNPKPICVTPPRIGLIEICANFHDIYFVGRNIHLCLNMEANFQGYELFDRSFDCMRIGDQGVKIVKPEDGAGLPEISNGNDAVIDSGNDEIEDYDENLIRKAS